MWLSSMRSLTHVKDAPEEILRFQPNHHVTLHHRGREAIDAMLETIDAAEQTIHLETYIFRADTIGERFIAALEARAMAGVSVRLIFDAVGTRGLDQRPLRRLARAGAEVAYFNPPSRWLWRFRPRQRDHRKILLVDGSVGFLGGLNIGDEYVGEDSDGPTWRDAHVRLEGPALSELQALFLENWFRSGGESFEWRSLLGSGPPSTGDQSVAILADGPTYRRRRVRSFFIDELRRAKSHVLLVSPYFAPGSRVLDALAEASDRGVDVEILLAGTSDHPILRRAVREIIPKLLRRGVRVYEDPNRMMHAKLAAFDESLAVVGTSNLDRQSLDHSCEVNAVFEGPNVGKWIHQHFGTDVLDVTPIDQDLLARRSLWTRGIDRIAAVWAKL
jgi:cardiolipin synthase A/B